MNEYISREELIDKLKMWLAELEAEKNKGYSDELYENKGAREAVECCIAEIETLPAAGVQPVIHCKDCKYAQNPNDTMVYCTYFECGTMSQNDFCSQGEKES